MRHHCAVGNLMYSHAMCVWPLVMFTRHQIAAGKKGPNLKTKDLQTHVYMNLLFLDVQLTTKICKSNIESSCIYCASMSMTNVLYKNQYTVFTGFSLCVHAILHD
jgi:hypothetical protein